MKTLITPSASEAVAILENLRPPQFAIDAAVAEARKSPCAKSQRGVVLYNDEDTDRWAAGSLEVYDMRAMIAGAGFNGPPRGFSCMGAERCGDACARLCLHAEDRAIRASGLLDDVVDLVLVHVKVVNGELVAGKRPCCEACSKVIVETGVKGVWLFEACSNPDDDDRWVYYDAVGFHLTTLDNLELPYSYRIPRDR